MEEEISSVLHLHMLMNAADADEKKVLPFREVSLLFSFVIPASYYHILKSKFTCPHAAVPSDTQVRLVLNI